MPKLTFATRPSALARWQTNTVCQQLHAAWPELRCQSVTITTKGDRVIDKPLPEIGGKGLFTHELEEAMRSGRVDGAVHSLKDLPTGDTPGLIVGVIPERANPQDVLVSPAGHTLDNLLPEAVVGTSSNRRRAQLLAYRSDLQIKPIRGNVDTRIQKAQSRDYDAVVLAAAGVLRLGLEEHISQYLPFAIMLPAPGQGAMAVQCRAEDTQTLEYLKAIDHLPTRLAVSAERAFLKTLGGGCSLPVGTLATVDGNEITLQAVVADLDGATQLHFSATDTDPQALGAKLGARALTQGAGELLS